VLAPLGAVQLTPTNQVSCTYRHAGYLYSNRPTFIAPGTGRITAIKVRSGPNPAKLRLTILTGSSRVDTTTGRYNAGTPMAIGYWPYTRVGEPRSADGYSMTGIDLMFQWFFKRP
jgi:hypothetical protein